MYKAFCDSCDKVTNHTADKCEKCGAIRKTMLERFREAEGRDLEVLPPIPKIFKNGER